MAFTTNLAAAPSPEHDTEVLSEFHLATIPKTVAISAQNLLKWHHRFDLKAFQLGQPKSTPKPMLRLR